MIVKTFDTPNVSLRPDSLLYVSSENRGRSSLDQFDLEHYSYKALKGRSC